MNSLFQDIISKIGRYVISLKLYDSVRIHDYSSRCRSSALNCHQFGYLLSAGAAVKKLLFRLDKGVALSLTLTIQIDKKDLSQVQIL